MSEFLILYIFIELNFCVPTSARVGLNLVASGIPKLHCLDGGDMPEI